MLVSSSTYYAWILVGVTSVASVLGSLVIYIDVIWNAFSSRHFSILHSDTFLGVSLSLSCGTLLITGLNALLPKSLTYILNGRPEYTVEFGYKLLVICVFCGSILCLIMNYIVLNFASNSLVACPHDLDTTNRPRKIIRHGSHEHLPLYSSEVHDHGAVRCEVRHADPEQNVGLENGTQSEASHSHSPHHHDPLSTSHATSSRLFSLSMQTTLGICVHRLPEGLMLFATSRADSELGLSMMLALSIHSFSEGFAVAAPLYGAIENRLKVVLFTILLVCGPQILGAYIGSRLFTTDNLPDSSKFHFGLCMAGTAGFMLVVSIQMIGNAFRYVSQNCVIYGVLAGVLISLFSRAI